jgi:hypothetical protein
MRHQLFKKIRQGKNHSQHDIFSLAGFSSNNIRSKTLKRNQNRNRKAKRKKLTPKTPAHAKATINFEVRNGVTEVIYEIILLKNAIYFSTFFYVCIDKNNALKCCSISSHSLYS